jgi:hypothetical protein
MCSFLIIPSNNLDFEDDVEIIGFDPHLHWHRRISDFHRVVDQIGVSIDFNDDRLNSLEAGRTRRDQIRTHLDAMRDFD